MNNLGYYPPPPGPYPGYGMPPRDHQSYQSQIEQLLNKQKELESRLYGNSSQPQGQNQPQPATQAPIQQVPQFLQVNSEEEIDSHVNTWDFKMSGRKMLFYNATSNEYISVWHDASIPKNIKRRYKENNEDYYELDLTDIGETQNNPVIERFDRLESELSEIKEMLQNGRVEQHTERNLELYDEEWEAPAERRPSKKPVVTKRPAERNAGISPRKPGRPRKEK